MDTLYYHRDTCCLCGSADLRSVVPLTKLPLSSPNVGVVGTDATARRIRETTVPLDIYLCGHCGHVQLADIVDPEVQYNNYRYMTAISLDLAQHFEGLAEDVITRLKPPAGGRIVEIGSNDGTLLRHFQNRGMEVLGVDPARDIARRATASGVRTLGTFFTRALAEKLRVAEGPVDAILANNVIANIDDLTDIIEGIKSLLAQDGVFVFETQYGVDVFEKMLLDTIYHEHISYFNVKPLSLFFAQHGMELIDVRRFPTKGGSIRGTVQRTGGARRAMPSVRELIGAEQAKRYDKPEPFRSFATSVAKLKAELGALIAEHEAHGELVAAYGASVGSLTLLHYFELTNRLAFIVDDTPIAEALSGPGYSIPIVNPSEIYRRRPGCIVVLAWRYADPIIAKHPEYLKQGGCFVLPLPEIKIVETQAA